MIFFWWLCTSTCAYCSDLFSVDIYRSTVYTSSVESSSRPRFAVDNDLLEEKPTCFQTNNSQPDSKGQHWLLIDFGYVLSNIKEIRLVTEAGYSLSNISAYIMRKPSLSLSQLLNVSKKNGALGFETPDAVLCSSTGLIDSWRTATTVQCQQPKNGRWLALRSPDGMHICMINVYVTQAHASCFDAVSVHEGKVRLAGVFRFIRHLTLGACRAACMGSPACNGLGYVQRSRATGNCHLMRLAPETLQDNGDDTNGGEITGALGEAVEERFSSICQPSGCMFEVNRCHEGHRFDLEKRSGQGDSDTGLTHKLVDVSLERTENWSISAWNSSFYANERNPRYLLSVHLQGYLSCNSWTCGSIRVSAIQADGYETICGEIDTVNIHVFDGFPILCDDYGYPNPVNISTVRLTWKPWHVSGAGETVKLAVNLVGGHVRLATRPPSPRPTGTTVTTTTNRVTSVSHDAVTKPMADIHKAEMNDDEYKVDPVDLLDRQLFSSLQPVPAATQIRNSSTGISSDMTPPKDVYKTIDSIQLNERAMLVNDSGYETRKQKLYEQPTENRQSEIDTKIYGKRGLTSENDNVTLSGSSKNVPYAVDHGHMLAYSPFLLFNPIIVIFAAFVDIFY